MGVGVKISYDSGPASAPVTFFLFSLLSFTPPSPTPPPILVIIAFPHFPSSICSRLLLARSSCFALPSRVRHLSPSKSSPSRQPPKTCRLASVSGPACERRRLGEAECAASRDGASARVWVRFCVSTHVSHHVRWEAVCEWWLQSHCRLITWVKFLPDVQ